MSKKNEGKVTAVKADVVVSDAVAPVVAPVVAEAKKDGRGAKMGVPHITDKVIQMTPAEREVWLDTKCGTPEIRKEVSARLTDILTNGKNHTTGKKAPDYASLFAGRDYDELVKAMDVLKTAIENSKVEAQKNLEAIIAKAEQEKLRLQEKFSAKV